MAPGSPLDPNALLQAMAAALPAHPGSDAALAPGTSNASTASNASNNTNDTTFQTATPTPTSPYPSTSASTSTSAPSPPDLSTPYEALALFAHACMTQLGFRLVGFDEDRVETFPDAPHLLPRWNARPTALSFVYAHSQSALTFVVRVDRMGAKAEIRGLATGAERIQRVELAVQDYVAVGELPWTATATTRETERTTDSLARLFFSRDRMAQLAARLQADIVQKLVPSLHKEGYEETADDRAVREDAERSGRQGGRPAGADAGAGAGASQPPANPYQPNPLLLDPLAAPRRPVAPAGDFAPPGFEDEYEIQRPPRGLAAGTAGIGIPNIGGDDLHPPGLGPNDPLRPFLGGGGLGGGRGRGGLRQPGAGGFGGMHPTFDDPLFGGPHGRGDGDGNGDGDGFDLQIPPGARYDDPTGGVGGLGPRFGGGRRPGGGSGGFNPYGGFGGGYGGGFGGGFGGDII